MWGVTIALTMAMVVMTGCGSSDTVSEEPKPVVDPVVPVVTPTTLELTRSEKVMVTESNAFAFNLFKVATAMVGPKSMILSPISITYALGMLNNGAAGATQEQINKVLGFGETGADSINAFCYKMLQMAPQQDPLTKVMIANTIYMNKGYELLPTFVEKARAFIKEFYPEWANAPITLHSWLLSHELASLLPEDSRILRFQRAFAPTEAQEDCLTAVLQWVYALPPQERSRESLSSLPEDTSLRRSMKAFLLSGGQIYAAKGTLARKFGV